MVIDDSRVGRTRSRVDKFETRRVQLAAAALQTLAELGYARTSLREIAQHSEFSHGVLHYYFEDKDDLLAESVRQFEAACVGRYDDIVATAGSAEGLRLDFGEAVAATLRADAPVHRLWYDLRNQSMFVESFRADVLDIEQRRLEMIWNVVHRHAELGGREPTVSPEAAYATLDGLFQRALLRHMDGRPEAADELRTAVRAALAGM
ncbi:TetR/AcrR family transcriptional regulator [Tsukamurella soli]|uniref:TetR/AcrR family transcriptional regulator n=1 Tax=Tsukamurella soli TaxID=644556 RepID=A0ABP8JM23_9ACTN